MPQDLLTEVLDYIEEADALEQQFNRTMAKDLQGEHAQLALKQSRLVDLLIDGNIGKDILETKNREI